jgi:hypothetical protein
MAGMTGSCGCGKVQYTVSADPIFTGICHCTSCRISTGSAYAILVGVPAMQIFCEMPSPGRRFQTCKASPECPGEGPFRATGGFFH